jgi:hypothetical protein
MAELFGVKIPAVNKHLKNIFATGELVEDSVVAILETTATDGKAYATRFYNLDAVIAVGFTGVNNALPKIDLFDMKITLCYYCNSGFN